MERQTLIGELRNTGRHPVRELRRAGRVPAVVYGHGVEARAIVLDGKALSTALRRAGGGILELTVTGLPPMHVLVREVQRHPTKLYIRHIDLQAVSMTEKVRVHVPVLHEGTAPVLSNSDMVLVRALDAVEVECLPADIPEHLIVDLAKLVDIDAEIQVRDIQPAAGVRILTEPDHVVFSVTASRAALLGEEPAEQAPEAPEVEVVSKRKPKEEEQE